MNNVIIAHLIYILTLVDYIGSDKQEVCLSPECIHAASRILKYMNYQVNPCNDFYKFVCGKFLEKINIPDDKVIVTKYTEMQDILQEQLKSLVEEPVQSNESRPFILLKKLYALCMDTDAIEEEGLNHIKLIIKQLGGWPVLEGDNWHEELFEWKSLTYQLRQKGINADSFISISVGDDFHNLKRRIIYIDQAELPIHKEFFTNGNKNKVMQGYYEFLVDVAVIFGANHEDALKEMKDCIDFIYELSEITFSQELRRNFTELSNEMTIDELHTILPEFPWLNYINKLINLQEIVVSGDEIINISGPKFFSDLQLLLKRTTKRTQANYIIGNIVISLSSYLTKQLREREFQFGTMVTGAKTLSSRWHQCVATATLRFHLPTSALYIRHYFDLNDKENVANIFRNLKNEFIIMLEGVEWMDAITKKRAIEKAISMNAHIAYPEELFNTDKLNEYYTELEPSSNFLIFILNFNKFVNDKHFRTLRKLIYKNDWRRHSRVTLVNAAYSVDENSIGYIFGFIFSNGNATLMFLDLPAGILQNIFFDSKRPNYMNYGAIGFVIGHEITHGFDDIGRQFDKNGLLEDWWTKDTLKTFVKKAECFINQYGNISYPELQMKLNGIIVQGETIADSGGIKEAYLAYNSWVERNGKEPRLPGLNFTPNQMFWISAANVWCSKERIEYLRTRILTDPHPPPYIRIVCAFANSEYFARDFQCPLGSRMNPLHKCSIW